jgi:gamma-glutamylcyclotransferase (GGCT)/AIG2-like uncharacterized protein YtfP
MSETENLKLFVYGTLRVGFGNHHLLTRLGAKPLRSPIYVITVRGELFEHGGLPMAKKSEDPQKTIVGEVYTLPSADCWKDLDSLEGHPNWYRREEVDLLIPGSNSALPTEKVWVYFMRPEHLEKYGNLKKIKNGDYRAAHSISW